MLWLLWNNLSQKKVTIEWQNICTRVIQELDKNTQNNKLFKITHNVLPIEKIAKLTDKQEIKKNLEYLAQQSPKEIFENYDILKKISQNNPQINIKDILKIAAQNNQEKEYKDYFVQTNWNGNKDNLILIFLESFSAVDSKKTSWIKDNLPLFDKIQSEWTTFKNFISNVSTSERSHIATLEWIEPLTLSKNSDPYYFTVQWYTDPLPVFFNKKGYETYFISSVTLNFLNQRTFLKNLKYKHIIWQEAFSWKQTYSFNAAPDKDLYDKTLEVVSQQTWKYFITLQTISSHEPYNTPYWKWEKEMFKYTDESLFNFYKQLKQKKFFDNGILILVWDHRKRKPVTEEENEKYWKSSRSRILATIIWDWITPRIDNKLYQHIDIFYSIKKLFSNGSATLLKYYNDMFSSIQNREWWIKEWWVNNKLLIVDTKKTDAILEYKNKKLSFRDNLEYPHNFEIIDYINSLLTYQNQITTSNNTSSIQKANSIKIIAHRGDSQHFLGNSMAAFKSARSKGVDGIEFDVSYTKDWYNIILHWPSMEATTCNKNLKIENLTLKEIEKCKLKNWEDILTLDNFLLKTKWRFDTSFLEIKVRNPDLAQQQTIKAINSVQQAWVQENIIFTSYDPLASYIFASYDDINSARDTYNITDIDKIKNTKHKYFMTEYHKITPELIQKTNIYNKNFLTYTINDTKEMEKLYQMWVVEFLTDNIDEAKERKLSHY